LQERASLPKFHVASSLKGKEARLFWPCLFSVTG
jgi:hypothetical protein